MDVQAYIEGMSEISRQTRSRYHLTLGALIDELKKLPNDAPVCFDSGMSPGKPHSYRGYYSDLSFEPISTETTVQDLLIYCTAALGATFTGYKGGDFIMKEETPLWAASYGCCGRALVGIAPTDYKVILVTKETD